MQHQNSVFHQLTKHIPWAAFDDAVSRHGSDRRVRRLRTRDQFLALLYGQLSGAASLREIEDGLSSQSTEAGQSATLLKLIATVSSTMEPTATGTSARSLRWCRRRVHHETAELPTVCNSEAGNCALQK